MNVSMSLDLLPAEFRIHALISKFTAPNPVIIKPAIMPPLQFVYECAAIACGTTREKCLEGDRKRVNVQARMIAANYVASNTNNSLAGIGHFLGGKDHSTVLHLRRAYANLMDVKDDDIIRCTNTFFELILQANPDHSIKNDLYRK